MRLSSSPASVIATALLLWTTQGAAQDVALRTVAEKAVRTNPQVAARLHAWRAAGDAVMAARAPYYPRVDVAASAGRDSDRITSRNPPGQSLDRTGATLSLTQLLWDGMGTTRDVERAGHERLARYFEWLDTAEQTALEAARAYYDVQRFRRLVELAEDNYVQHKYAALQIQSRVAAGVGRGVDLEQANARLALAESNLATEGANLHDVTARYQRIVGEPPAQHLPPHPPLTRELPVSAEQAIEAAIRQSATINASIEALRAARASAHAREGAYQPRVEARLRAGSGRHLDAVRDQTRDSSAEIMLNWNLFNGGADQARVRQQLSLVNQATELRDQACRDTRQTAAIAYNDIQKLALQLQLLDRNTLAIEKARDAYRQQFDIGQRSLLDLLNAENELYTARRAYANAEFDLRVAYARTHAAMSRLTTQLGIATLDAEATQAAGWAAGDDGPGRCPVGATEVAATSRDELDARARRIAESTAPTAPRKP